MYKKRLTVWSHALGVCLIFMLGFWSITYPYRSLSDDGRSTAQTFIKALGKNYSHNMTIYKGSQISNIYALGCYLGVNVKKISNLKELPSNAKTVYLLSLSTPIYPKRQWENISNVHYGGKYLSLWKGVVINKLNNLEV